jgi:hypothetical protein
VMQLEPVAPQHTNGFGIAVFGIETTPVHSKSNNNTPHRKMSTVSLLDLIQTSANALLSGQLPPTDVFGLLVSKVLIPFTFCWCGKPAGWGSARLARARAAGTRHRPPRTLTHTRMQLHARARTLAQTLTRSTRSLHRPACCLQSCTVVESAADACLDPRIDKSPQSAAAPLFAQQTNNCSKLCPMDVAVTSVRRSDRMHRFADSGQACPSRLSICPLFGCAGHS